MKTTDLDGHVAELNQALGHPVRVRALELLSEAPASPSALSRTMDVPVGTVSYHVRVLAAGEWIELVETRPRRGAVEHIYRTSGKAKRHLVMLDEVAWTKLIKSADRLSARVLKLEAETAERAASGGACAQVPVVLVTLVHTTRPPAAFGPSIGQ